MSFEEFEEKVERLVEDEELVKEVKKEGEDLYQWVGE